MSGLTMTAQGALVRRAGLGNRPTPFLEDLAFATVLGDSRAIRATVDYVRTLAMQDTVNVLLVGDPGTGKGLFARALHAAGPKAHLPFVALDCAAAPSALLESELFGYEPGAFEGSKDEKKGLLELAGGGTVLLENVECLPARLQSKLMHGLAKRRSRRVGGRDAYGVSATIIASTSRSLESLVAEGSFRQDLFFELNAPRVSVPSLTERGDDVVLLAQRFLNETTREQGLRPVTLTAEAKRTLLNHDWPGNVRELRTVARRAAELADGPLVHPEHLSIEVGQRVRSSAQEYAAGTGRSLREIERDAIAAELNRCGGNPADAARALQIGHSDLMRKVAEYGLEVHLRTL